MNQMHFHMPLCSPLAPSIFKTASSNRQLFPNTCHIIKHEKSKIRKTKNYVWNFFHSNSHSIFLSQFHTLSYAQHNERFTNKIFKIQNKENKNKTTKNERKTNSVYSNNLLIQNQSVIKLTPQTTRILFVSEWCCFGVTALFSAFLSLSASVSLSLSVSFLIVRWKSRRE